MEIDSIWKKYYSSYHLPNLLNSVGDGVVRLNSKLTGFGIIKLRPECLIFLEKDQSERLKAATLLKLQQEAIKSAKAKGYDELIAGITDKGYASLLTKHFNFKVESGVLMRLEL